MKILLALAIASALAAPALGGSLLEGAVADAKKPETPAPATRIDPREADEAQALEAFRKLQATHQHLDDVTVRVADTPNGEEAVSYYTVGEIVIDPDHTVSIDTILAHEIWHVIDWRDNGQLDWGEDLPPVNAEEYRVE